MTDEEDFNSEDDEWYSCTNCGEEFQGHERLENCEWCEESLCDTCMEDHDEWCEGDIDG